MDYAMGRINTDACSRRCAPLPGYMLGALERGLLTRPPSQEEQYRLWLNDPLALYGVENAKLAPGYQAPSSPKKR